MKKFLTLALFFVSLAINTQIKAQALTNNLPYTLLTGSTDSVTTTTKYLTANLDGDIVGGSIVVALTKSSGTTRVALTLQVSNDNSNWVDWTTGTSHTLGANTVTDTMLNTAGAQYKVFDLTDLCQDFKYVRVKLVPTGSTGHTLLTGSYIYRRKRS